MGVHSRFSVQNSGFSSYMFVCLCLSSCFCVQHAEHSPENDVGQPSRNASQTAPVDEETQEGRVDEEPSETGTPDEKVVPRESCAMHPSAIGFLIATFFCCPA